MIFAVMAYMRCSSPRPTVALTDREKNVRGIQTRPDFCRIRYRVVLLHATRELLEALSEFEYAPD